MTHGISCSFAARRQAALRCIFLAGAALLAGCGPTRFEAELKVPPPLVTKIPIVVGVYIPPEFANRVYEEKRREYSVSVAIGKAQTDGFLRLMDAMFLRVGPVQGTGAGSVTDADMRGVLEPVLEDFSFITPRDSNAPVYAVSVKYRINGYRRDGQLFESWTFTGYGSVESSTMGLKGTNALKAATGLAMRDAASKLAAEFREQAIVRGLLPANPPPATPLGAPTAGNEAATPQPTAPATAIAPAPEQAAPAEQPPTASDQTPVESEQQPAATEQAPAPVTTP